MYFIYNYGGDEILQVLKMELLVWVLTKTVHLKNSKDLREKQINY